MKYEDDLHNCTPERLAEMLEAMTVGLQSWHCTRQAATCMEAARRLRELGKPTYK